MSISRCCPKSVVRLPSYSPYGAVAQLGEHRVCNAGVTGSIPVGSIPSKTFRHPGDEH